MKKLLAILGIAIQLSGAFKYDTSSVNIFRSRVPSESKCWQHAYITSDGDKIYTCEYLTDNLLGTWKFEEHTSLYWEAVPKDSAQEVVFTDEHCYLYGSLGCENGKKGLITYPIRRGGIECNICETDCKAWAASKAGLAILTSPEKFIFLEAESGESTHPILLKKTCNDIGILDSGEAILNHCGAGITVVRPDDCASAVYIPLSYVTGPYLKMLNKKTSNGQIILACWHKAIKQVHIDLVGTQEGSGALSMPIDAYPKAWDLAENKLVVATNGTERNCRTKIKIFDLNTGTQTYEGGAGPLHGTCALRLIGDKLKFASDSPTPTSVTIDARQSSSSFSSSNG